MPQVIPRYLATNPCRLKLHTVAASYCACSVAHGCSLLHLVAGLNLSGLSSGTVHRAVGLSSAGRVHDASWDTESLFLTLQVFPTVVTTPCPALTTRCSLVITPMPLVTGVP